MFPTTEWHGLTETTVRGDRKRWMPVRAKLSGFWAPYSHFNQSGPLLCTVSQGKVLSEEDFVCWLYFITVKEEQGANCRVGQSEQVSADPLPPCPQNILG